jgi:hypothetical protein
MSRYGWQQPIPDIPAIAPAEARKFVDNYEGKNRVQATLSYSVKRNVLRNWKDL